MSLLPQTSRWSRGSISWLLSQMLGSVDMLTHLIPSSLLLFIPPPLIYREGQQRVCDYFMCSTCLAFVALQQSAGSVSFWLINVQFEVYYEPPGFNYYTITQSIPCHFIFMVFIMPWYVQLPNFVLNAFYLISWILFHFSHLSRLLFISVPCVYFLLLLFHQSDLSRILFLFLFPGLYHSLALRYSS